MRLLLAAAAALLLSSCAAVPKVYRYEALGFQIIKADRDSVDRICRARIKTNDFGEPLRADRRLRCCFLFSPFDLDEIYVAQTDPDCILEELCHAAGKPREDCARKYNW